MIIHAAKGLVRKSSKVNWHDLRNTKPVADNFGFIRGTPVDRFYIEKFLDVNRKYIRGRVMEIADSTYSKKFGSAVEQYETFGTGGEKSKVSIVGDLSDLQTLPINSMDCFICTQTFNFIYDRRSNFIINNTTYNYYLYCTM